MVVGSGEVVVVGSGEVVEVVVGSGEVVGGGGEWGGSGGGEWGGSRGGGGEWGGSGGGEWGGSGWWWGVGRQGGNVVSNCNVLPSYLVSCRQFSVSERGTRSGGVCKQSEVGGAGGMVQGESGHHGNAHVAMAMLPSDGVVRLCTPLALSIHLSVCVSVCVQRSLTLNISRSSLRQLWFSELAKLPPPPPRAQGGDSRQPQAPSVLRQAAMVTVTPTMLGSLVGDEGAWQRLWAWLPEWSQIKYPKMVFKATNNGYK